MSDTNGFQNIRPPNEVLVEVEDGGEIIQVMAFYGRDGYRPHWTDADRLKQWPVDAFPGGWRPIAKPENA